MFDDIKHLFSILRDPDRFGEFWVLLSLILGGLLGRTLFLNYKKQTENTENNFSRSIDSLKHELIEKIQDVSDLGTREISEIRRKQLSDAAKVASYSEECRVKSKAIDDLNINVVSLTNQFTGISNFQNLVAENSKNEILRIDMRVNGMEGEVKELKKEIIQGNKETMSAISKVNDSVSKIAESVGRIDERTKKGDS